MNIRSVQRLRRFTLTQRLFGLSLFSLLPALAALLLLASTLHRQREREVHDLALRIGELANLEFGRIITGVEGTLYTLSRAPAVRSLEPEACSRYVNEVAAGLPHLRGIVVADAAGTLRCGTGIAGNPIAVNDRSYFIEATQSAGLVVGEFTVSRIDGLKMLPLALPVRKGDRLEAVVITGLNLDWLAETLKQRDYLEGAALTVADRNGMIIAREPFPETFVGTQIPEPFMDLVRGQQSGSMLVTSQDGTQRIIGYHPPAVGGNGLYVSAGFSTDTAFGPIYASTLRSLAIAGFGAIAALGLAWIAGDRLIHRPVSRILATVERWRHGDEAARTGITPSSSELDSLAHAVDEYMDALTADRAARRGAEASRDLLHAELEHRVKNMLATVQVIATQTFKETDDPDRLETFRQRLVAMGEAHAMLSSDDWQRADLRTTIETALRPFGLDQERRIALQGPRFLIAPRAALALSMAIHELCTNAGKYGALSNAIGEVSIDWHVTRPSPERRFVLTWKERGGPVNPSPGLPGFGTRMIETALGFELGGSAKLSFSPTGAAFILDVPAENIVIEEPAGEASAA